MLRVLSVAAVFLATTLVWAQPPPPPPPPQPVQNLDDATDTAPEQEEDKLKPQQDEENAELRDEKAEPKEEEDDDKEAEEEEVDPTLRPLQYYKEEWTRCLSTYDCFWKYIQIDGYIDQTYTHNFNRPYDRVNSLRVFDRKDRAYLLNMFQLYVRKDPTEESRWGFATRLAAGWDADVISPFEVPNTDKADIEEAYLSYLFDVPVGKSLLVKAGKFVTLAGAEVIEQKDNFNISRSFLFGYAIPFTHTGVRAAWAINDMYTFTFGVNRGYEMFNRDNNDSLTYEGALNVTCSDKLSMAAVTYIGPEQEDNVHSTRRLLDLVATYKFTDKLTGVVNADFGEEEDAAPNGTKAKWRGIAGYLKYDCTDKLSYAARAEVFSDPDGARTGLSQTLSELTLTTQYKFRENLWGRLEYRHDHSNSDQAFTKGRGLTSGQNTLAASVLITF